MSKHSLGAYRIVLQMRTARTLLVEGESDKNVMQRFLLDYPIEDRHMVDRPAIDTPSLLSDNRLSGLGHKAKVEIIAENLPFDQNKFMALIDREWEEFDIETMKMAAIEDDYFAPSQNKIKTFGHSIENYFFEVTTILSLLRRQFPNQLTPGILRLIEDKFHKICTIALAYSLAAKKHQVISRLCGLISRQHVTLTDTNFELNASFLNCLTSRGISLQIAQLFIDSAKTYQIEITERALSIETMKWASHGHLGNETIWACVAKILEVSGVEMDACEQVERGMQSDKLKHGADALAMSHKEQRPLDWLARWLLGIEGRELTA